MDRINEVTILVVDDAPENLDIIGELLKGYKQKVATNGEKALKIAFSDNPPNLILLDVMMPEMDGFEVCRRLKSNPRTKNIPVIFITAKNQPEDIVKGFEIGGVDYVTKPFNPAELIARVTTHIELKKSRDIVLRQNEELKQKNDELEKLIDRMNEFLGMAAHDLRNPLTAILLCSEMIQSQLENSHFNQTKGMESIEKIFNLAERMNRIISDLLSISTIESGKIRLELQSENMNSILDENFDFFKQVANEKKIQFVLKKDQNIPEIMIMVDKFRITQVIENLLSNAIKYTSPGGIVTLSSKVSDSKMIIDIEDNGLGLDEQDLQLVFQSFQKLSAKPTGGELSTGLGLAIVKKIIDLHNGEIWVKSEKGKGSTFSFALPL